ncbi:MAG: hypothetical protein N0E59_21265 [Candidatus Thiodiazotropha taylori]|nr:hypothetical protein [Candidatus Thiodiazotropha taylori]MCG8113289.1 hypothetical protein [Candidatus Thiodiazotropha taylori]MCW4285650.1 hypothetical protein [Candidatus Thiodiazotropha taylori]MCW4327739.1 hypothetical protein [Candidatus Thiodiazotropha taylori]
MSNVTTFTPKGKTPAINLKEFVEHCKDNLSIYEEQGGFGVHKWKTSGKRPIAMQFGVYQGSVAQYDYQPFSEPFLSFSQSYVRYIQTIKESQAIIMTMDGLKALYDALVEIHGEPDPLKIDGLVQQKTVELLNQRRPGSDTLYRVGGALEKLYKLMRDKGIAPALPEWKRPWKRGRSKADRTDEESRRWQEERCPSQHQMLALADCFNKATTVRDKYWSSVITLLMFAPGRAGELEDLAVDCLGEEKGRHYISWEGEKGFGGTRKWIPSPMVEPVKEAVKRLLEIGRTAREAAKFSYENPGVFMRHDGCVTAEGFPENKKLKVSEARRALGMKEKKGKEKWFARLQEGDGLTYQRLAQHAAQAYQDKHWPHLGGTNRYIWDSLLLHRENEFHSQFSPKAFSWRLPTVNQVNDQLSPRIKTIKTIFQRFGIADENGEEISLTSHQLRVWLSTNAERGGMDSWLLAQWAGRSRVQDNRHYDLRTREERNRNAREILTLTERPTALQSVKLNLPVAYADLGINRIGVADVTLYGMCVHDYAESPCSKAGECMTCKEHVCIKGMPKTLDRMKQMEASVAQQLQNAKNDAKSGAFGADRWVTHLGWKLAHISTQIQRLESEEVPEGAVLWIPPEHDPSPVKRALEARGYDSGTGAESPDIDAIKSLMEL